MDKETIGKVKNLIRRTAKKYGIDLEKIIVFGSRVRDNYREKSDVDLLLVSPDFRGVAWNRRPGPFYEEWDYDELPEPEFVCLTPEEFKEKSQREAHIVRNAVEKGMVIKPVKA